ncbi:homoserine O-acetyltransferase [Aspergillus udagawae]|uniref:Homoserine O-acetyltransferase n=1 Tax=Aspergillus udagawae TaxID=91492 RepID=A0A8H3MY71_9EURO|nr:homoserine O-acetyltransferase [Aspergillus udagawae]
MEPALSRRKSISTKQSLSFLFSSQRREECSRYYDLKHTPIIFRRRSVLIERRKISPRLEREIRWSCVLLAKSIEQEEFQHDIRQTQTCHDASHPPEKVEVHAAVSAPGEQSQCNNDIRKYDSAIELDTQPVSSLTGELPSTSPFQDLHGFHSSSNHDSSTSASSPATTCSDMTFCTGLSSTEPSLKGLAPNVQDQHSTTEEISVECPPAQSEEAFLAGESSPNLSTDEETVSDDVEVFLSPDKTTINLGRTPSLSRPCTKIAPLNNKPRCEDCQAVPQSNTTEAHETNDGDITANHLPSNPVEFGATCIRKRDDQPSAIVDSSGVVHIMTDAEEAQRNSDLQLAVMEKMKTGIIRCNVASPAEQDAAAPPTSDEPPLPASAKQKNSSFWSLRSLISKESLASLKRHPKERKTHSPSHSRSQSGSQSEAQLPPKTNSLLRKMSILDMGRHRPGSASRSRDTAGFNRIVS